MGLGIPIGCEGPHRAGFCRCQLRRRAANLCWCMPMRSLLGPLLLLALTAAPLRAQSLEDDLNQLFIFGEGDEALHLGGSAASENPGIAVHGMPRSIA